MMRELLVIYVFFCFFVFLFFFFFFFCFFFFFYSSAVCLLRGWSGYTGMLVGIGV